MIYGLEENGKKLLRRAFETQYFLARRLPVVYTSPFPSEFMSYVVLPRRNGVVVRHRPNGSQLLLRDKR